MLWPPELLIYARNYGTRGRKRRRDVSDPPTNSQFHERRADAPARGKVFGDGAGSTLH